MWTSGRPWVQDSMRMRRPRRRLPVEMVEVTVRCHRSEMRLVPTAERVQIIGFTLAQACRRHPGVEVLAVCQMSNHLHLVLRDADGSLSAFMQYFVGNVARRLNRLDRLHGAVFERRFSEIVIVDEVALVHRIAYAIANPVEARLVRSHREWTGLCAFARAHGLARVFGHFHAARYEAAAKRSEVSVGRDQFREEAVLEMGVLEAELAARVEAAVKAREARLREGQRGVVGMAEVEAMSPLSRPERSSRSPMPLCFASTEDGWERFVSGWRSFCHAFHAAALRFRMGVLDVAFPAGAFRPSSWAG